MFHIFLLFFFKQIFINRKQKQHNNKKQNPPRYCYRLRMIIKNFIDILYCFHFIFVCTDFKTLPLSFHICVYWFKTWLALHAEPKTVQHSRPLCFFFFLLHSTLFVSVKGRNTYLILVHVYDSSSIRLGIRV